MAGDVLSSSFRVLVQSPENQSQGQDCGQARGDRTALPICGAGLLGWGKSCIYGRAFVANTVPSQRM